MCCNNALAPFLRSEITQEDDYGNLYGEPLTSLWQNIKSGFAYAFSVESEEKIFSEEDLALLDKVAGFVVKRRMETPAILFLESMHPLNFIGSQVMVFLQPILTSFFSIREYERLAAVLERRESIGLLIERIEARRDKTRK